MTVLENVMIGRHCRTRAKVFGAIFRDPATKREENKIVQFSYNLIEKVGLASQVNEFARNLSYGAQRRLEIARALATEPDILGLQDLGMLSHARPRTRCGRGRSRRAGSGKNWMISSAGFAMKDFPSCS